MMWLRCERIGVVAVGLTLVFLRALMWKPWARQALAFALSTCMCGLMPLSMRVCSKPHKGNVRLVHCGSVARPLPCRHSKAVWLAHWAVWLAHCIVHNRPRWRY